MLTKLIGHTIKAIKIYKPTHGKRIFGYNAGDMKEKLINTSETNFVIYYRNSKVSLMASKDCTDYIIFSCASPNKICEYKDIIKEMKKLIGNKIIEVEFKKKEECVTYGKLYRLDEYYYLRLSNGDRIPICLSILSNEENKYDKVPLVEKYVMEVGKNNGKRIFRK